MASASAAGPSALRMQALLQGHTGHIYTYIHIYTYTPTHLHTYTPTHLHLHLFACTHTHTCIHIYTYINTYMHTVAFTNQQRKWLHPEARNSKIQLLNDSLRSWKNNENRCFSMIHWEAGKTMKIAVLRGLDLENPASQWFIEKLENLWKWVHWERTPSKLHLEAYWSPSWRNSEPRWRSRAPI